MTPVPIQPTRVLPGSALVIAMIRFPKLENCHAKLETRNMNLDPSFHKNKDFFPAPARLGAPIVLVHGLFGFDRITLAGMTVAQYFPGIPELLTSAGNRVLVPFLSPCSGVAERARQLKAFLDREAPGEAVHLVAHSMGGLDCRYMISRLDMAKRVLTLTTLGTPHRGTPFADWGIRNLERLVKPFFQLLSIPHQAFYDLTTDGCRAFNEQVPDDPRVRYFSVAGEHDGHWLRPEWLFPYSIVFNKEGPNDGVVSVASATYGERIEIWRGDHFSLVNWPNPLGGYGFAARASAARYGPLVRRLADEGF
jgi:triacylglycerol lipase